VDENQHEHEHQGDEHEAPAPGHVRRYKVQQPDGRERHQLILITHTDEHGHLRGLPLCYEDEAGSFLPEHLL
jgi:hypothetical protein